jgi:hypothetical protein
VSDYERAIRLKYGGNGRTSKEWQARDSLFGARADSIGQIPEPGCSRHDIGTGAICSGGAKAGHDRLRDRVASIR